MLRIIAVHDLHQDYTIRYDLVNGRDYYTIRIPTEFKNRSVLTILTEFL